jgi:hypothetical protein
MDHTALLDRIVERDRRIAALQAEQFADVAALAGSHPVVDEILVRDQRPGQERSLRVVDAVREELACALRLAPVTAGRLIDRARMLAGPLKPTLTALAAGEITQGHALVMIDAADQLGADAEACSILQERVLPVARRGTSAQTRARARSAVLSLDPAGHARSSGRRSTHSDVLVIDDGGGMSTLLARLSTLRAHAVFEAVSGRASACEGEDAGERRARALVGLVLGGLRRVDHLADSESDGTSPEHAPAALSIALDVTIDLPTLVGLADEPALVAGSSAIPAQDLRDLLADTRIGLTLRRLVLDPLTGHLLDRGRSCYVPTGALRAFIVSRDRTCRFPGCRRRAGACEIDHVESWRVGGRTDRDNLQALCTRHHLLKTHLGWSTVRREGGGSVWTSPQGRRHESDRSLVADTGPPRSRLAG